MAIEVADGAGLAELLDAERFDAMAAHAAKPAECCGMTVEHGNNAALARQRRQQFFDMAEMWQSSAVAALFSRRGPAAMQPVGGGDRKQPDIPSALANQPDRLDRLGRERAGISDHEFGIRTGLAQPIGAVGDALLQVRRHDPLRLLDGAGPKPQINPTTPPTFPLHIP